MNVNEVITQTIIDKLKSGVIPWQRPYQGVDVPPMNFKSKNAYRGINTLMLSMTGHKSPYWLTYKQAKEVNPDAVIKPKSGHKIIFAKTTKYQDKEGKDKQGFIYRYSHVHNLDDITGIECPHVEETIEINEFQYIENCENAMNDMVTKNKIPSIRIHSKAIACYFPTLDEIRTCPREEYVNEEAYYSVMFHEIIHSTGHNSRLDRTMTGSMSSQSYAKEELIAEIGACFLCGLTGIVTKTIENSASYIQGWLSHLKDDPSLVIQAASRAQKAFDYLDVKILETKKEEI
jgi:antirestriction protein ArdC